uniref:Uncharacterized protein n=2 Tax=viral metagenome TaxID=1070528 RepID=A0A6M3X864_9ZZZZ
MEVQAATCFLFSLLAFAAGIILLVISTDKEVIESVAIRLVILIAGWSFCGAGVGLFIVGAKYLGACI